MRALLPLLILAFTATACHTSDKGEPGDQASSVKDDPAALPSAEVLKGFKDNCIGCHPTFKLPGNKVKWEAIAAAGAQVALRLNWEAVNPEAMMPPPDTDQNLALAEAPELRQKMLEAVKAAMPAPGGALPLAKLKLPPGFSVKVFAEIPGARSLAVSPKGTVFVGSANDAGQYKAVWAIQDVDKDGIGESVYKIANNLSFPNGVAFKDGDLYVAEIKRIVRFKNIEANLASPGAPEALPASFPGETHHGRKFIAFGPDGKLYVPVGAPCNICEPSSKHAKLFRMNADGTGVELFAKGIRNTVGFSWHPETKELWFTENGRDLLGDNEPPDELNRASTFGLDFGFPRCHSMTPDPEFGGTQGCTGVTAPAQKLKAHVAALGMRFYAGSQFPAEYKHDILIAEHGSWNSSVPVGYRISRVKLDGSSPTSYETFISGWVESNGSRWGRPVDVAEMPDGALLISDDHAGVVYRVSYAAP